MPGGTLLLFLNAVKGPVGRKCVAGIDEHLRIFDDVAGVGDDRNIFCSRIQLNLGEG